MWISASVFSSSSFGAVNTVSGLGIRRVLPEKKLAGKRDEFVITQATSSQPEPGFDWDGLDCLHIWWPCYAIFISFCVQNKQQKRWEKMALGLLVSNFYKFAQFFSQLFVFFLFLSCFDKTGKMKFRERTQAPLKTVSGTISCVSYLAVLFPPVPKKQIWFIYERKKWWKILQTSKFFH